MKKINIAKKMVLNQRLRIFFLCGTMKENRKKKQNKTIKEVSGKVLSFRNEWMCVNWIVDAKNIKVKFQTFVWLLFLRIYRLRDQMSSLDYMYIFKLFFHLFLQGRSFYGAMMANLNACLIGLILVETLKCNDNYITMHAHTNNL